MNSFVRSSGELLGLLLRAFRPPRLALVLASLRTATLRLDWHCFVRLGLGFFLLLENLLRETFELCKNAPEGLMKKVFSVGIAALFLATGAAHASMHRSWHLCGEYLITDAWDADTGDHWAIVPDHNKSFMEKNNYRKIPKRLVKSRVTSHGEDLYYRGQKCRNVWADDGIKAMKWPDLPPPKPEPLREPPSTPIPPAKDCSG